MKTTSLLSIILGLILTASCRPDSPVPPPKKADGTEAPNQGSGNSESIFPGYDGSTDPLEEADPSDGTDPGEETGTEPTDPGESTDPTDPATPGEPGDKKDPTTPDPGKEPDPSKPPTPSTDGSASVTWKAAAKSALPAGTVYMKTKIGSIIVPCRILGSAIAIGSASPDGGCNAAEPNPASAAPSTGTPAARTETAKAEPAANFEVLSLSKGTSVDAIAQFVSPKNIPAGFTLFPTSAKEKRYICRGSVGMNSLVGLTDDNLATCSVTDMNQATQLITSFEVFVTK
jgi:hypothetical protein